jgi:5,10-methylenetetrahydromethanopterin reductase
MLGNQLPRPEKLMAVEFWKGGRPRASAADSTLLNSARQAMRAEEVGYDGCVFSDSQNRAPDCYIALAMAAQATSTIKLGTSVTNSFTRHAAVTASAILTVQAESGGRAHLGIGRGDTALAYLGRAPDAVSVFEDYLKHVQAYLRGEEVPFAAGGTVESLDLADRPASSRIEWMPADLPKVPVSVAATGPKVIAAAARHADRVTFAVGADAERIRWGMEVARAARAEAGLSPEIPFGAYVTLVVHDDPEEAMRMGEAQLSLFARFSVMYGTIVGPASESQRKVLHGIHDAYDIKQHGRAGSPQAASMTAEFSRTFGVFGPPSYCADRLSELIELGIDRFIITGTELDPNNPQSTRSHERFFEEVVPALRKPI